MSARQVLLESPAPLPMSSAPGDAALERNQSVLRLEVTTRGHCPAPLGLYLGFAQVDGVWRGVHSEPSEGWRFIEPLCGPAWGGRFIRGTLRTAGVKDRAQEPGRAHSALPYLRRWRDALEAALDPAALVMQTECVPLGHATLLGGEEPRNMRDKSWSFAQRYQPWQDTPHTHAAL